MSYVNRSVDDVIPEPGVASKAVADYHDRVRWGPIISGLVITLAMQLVLSAIVAAIGASAISGSGAPRTNAGDVAGNVGIWSTICLLISLFLGGWATARACGPMNRSTALLNGAILWATTLAISSWLVASGVSGAFGVAASNAGSVVNQVQQSGGLTLPRNVPNPNITAQQARDIAAATARGFWWFAFGSLLSLIAALIGSSVGTRKPRNNYS